MFHDIVFCSNSLKKHLTYQQTNSEFNLDWDYQDLFAHEVRSKWNYENAKKNTDQQCRGEKSSK